MNHKINIVFTGGGSGGHITPLVSVAREVKKINSEINLYYLGPNDFATRNFFPDNIFIMRQIMSAKYRRYFSWQNVIDLCIGLPVGFLQSFFWLLIIRPRLVFSKGGSGSYVVCLAAWFLDIPVFIHESDSVPGLSNKKVASWARKMFTSFEKTEYLTERGAWCTGNPIRQELLTGSFKEAKASLAINSQKPTLLFLGGSQGAQFINDFVAENLKQLLWQYEVIHIAGVKNYTKVVSDTMGTMMIFPELKPFYHLHATLNEVELTNAYAATDIVIARASAASIFEIAALGKPSILIPLPTSAGDHQSKNAYQYSQTGASLTIEQNNITPNFFLGQVEYLLNQKEKIKLLAQQFARPDAAKKIAQEIIEFIK